MFGNLPQFNQTPRNRNPDMENELPNAFEVLVTITLWHPCSAWWLSLCSGHRSSSEVQSLCRQTQRCWSGCEGPNHMGQSWWGRKGMGHGSGARWLPIGEDQISMNEFSYEVQRANFGFHTVRFLLGSVRIRFVCVWDATHVTHMLCGCR